MDPGGSMQRTRTLVKADQNKLLGRDGVGEFPNLRQLLNHRPKERQTTKRNRLDFARSNATQLLAPIVSHDIRHHLTSISCNVEFMSDPDICQVEREQLLAEVLVAIHDMTDLLDAFLHSIRTGETLHFQSKSMNKLVRHAVAMVRLHPDARECEFVTRDALCIQCQIDSQRLGAAIYNLLLNACQALKRRPSPKKVEIALWIDDSSVCIRVEDNGDDVPDCIRNILFQPFVTADRMCGIGLGLTIADQAAREHGGSLNLEESIPGKTAFVLRLPKLILEAALIEERSG
jgi:signal transduction histidine kinase